jgi:hypothetical protein
MSRTYHHGKRSIRVRGIKKDPPDLRRFSRALIALVQAEAEAEAQADRKAKEKKSTPNPKTNNEDAA